MMNMTALAERPMSGERSASHADAVTVYRDEVLDDRTRISGYRFRTVSADSSVPPSPPAKVRALKEDNLARFAQNRMALVPITCEEWRAQDFRQFVTPNIVFHVELPPPGGDILSWQAGLKDIKASGAKLAIDHVALGSGLGTAMKLANAVFLHPDEHSLDELGHEIGELRNAYPALHFAIDDVNTWPEYRTYLRLGTHYCLGHFATTPEGEDQSESFPHSRQILLDMLNLLRREASVADLTSIAIRYPAAVAKVLDTANPSVLMCPLDRGAIDVAGDAMCRWLAIAIFRAGAGARCDEAQLALALRRARLIELLAVGRFSKQESDDLFVLGLISLMDRLLGIPLAKVLAHLPLPPHITEVLLRSQGKYARFLFLGIALENAHGEWANHLAGDLGLSPDAIAACNATAIDWTSQAMAVT